jgi:hypothetical protein
MHRSLTMAAAMLLSSCGEMATAQTFMPDNMMHLEPNLAPTMSKAEFDKVLDKAEAYYRPLLKEAFGAELKVNRKWTDETVNASAYQSGKYWYLNMYGGLARRVTQDGFLVVICHELGHHLGGYPFYSKNTGWAAAIEGQADYFATQSCMRNLLVQEKDKNEQAESTIPSIPKGKCDKAHEGIDDRRLCYRIVQGGKSTADLLSGRTNGTRYENRDTRQVAVTYEPHPNAQCRLDTYTEGALCRREFDEKIIPGKDLGGQKNSILGEKEAAEVSCHSINSDTTGLRPRCWFAPKVK